MKEEEPGASQIQEYDAVVELANRTKEPLDSRSIATIESLIKDLDKNDDPVFQVNCLQLIADLACSKQALNILEEKKVPEKLFILLDQCDPLIVPHALKFFYRVDPKDLETKYPQVLDRICDFCHSDSAQLLDYAVDFIAAVARGGHLARQILDKHPKFKQICLSKMGSTIVSSDSMIKSRTLRCITDLLEIHDDDPKVEAGKLSETFYHSMLEGNLKMTNQLLALCRVPFLEIRINAMLVISVIADQIWAQRELEAHPNFLKWILDRSTETSKESKEAKFEILKALVKSRTTPSIFKGEDYMKMRADFKNGPFHVGIAEEMLMDDKSAN